MIEWIYALLVGLVAAVGIYLALARDLAAMVVGLLLIGVAANLFVFGAGRLDARGAPLVPSGQDALPEGAGDPLAQAMVLTAIVIGFALACFAIALVLRLQSLGAGADPDALDDAEPRPHPNGEPGELA